MSKHIFVFLFVAASFNCLAFGLEGIFVSPDVTVEVYVEDVNTPQDLSFDSRGYLYVANDANADARIHRVSPDGTSVDFFGPTVSDPDAVIVHANDAVLVGSGTGKIYKVLPDGSSSVFASTYLGGHVPNIKRPIIWLICKIPASINKCAPRQHLSRILRRTSRATPQTTRLSIPERVIDRYKWQ